MRGNRGREDVRQCPEKNKSFHLGKSSLIGEGRKESVNGKIGLHNPFAVLNDQPQGFIRWSGSSEFRKVGVKILKGQVFHELKACGLASKCFLSSKANWS
jgi:hypothetical protein